MSCYRPKRACRTKVGSLRFLSNEETWRRRSAGKDVLSIPCGKCIGCRLDRAEMWTIRIMHEASLHDANSFITLTYDDVNLPWGDRPTLDVRDYQLFVKRIRKSGLKVRYFAAGEYGSESGRPHYHAIFFGWRPKFSRQVTQAAYASDELDEFWPLGNSTCGAVTPASAAYVAQYSMKKQVGRDQRNAGRAAECLLISQGIGLGWLKKFSSELNNGYVVVDGKKKRIPRYYIEKKGFMSEFEADWYLLRRLEARVRRNDPELWERYSDEQLAKSEAVELSKRKFFGSGNSREPDEVVI